MYSQKFYALHKACVKNMHNERKLGEKISQLKKNLSHEGLKLEKANQQKKDHEQKLKTLEERLEQVKKETNDVDERNTILQTEISKLESQKQEQASDFAQKEQ